MANTGLDIAYKAPKFLLGGVNYRENFLGIGTTRTAIYGCAEVAIKVTPIFAAIYGAKHLTSSYIPDRDVYLDERNFIKEKPKMRRASFT